jgi:hypothetical protein
MLNCALISKLRKLEAINFSYTIITLQLHPEVTETKNKTQSHQAQGPPDLECELCALGGMELFPRLSRSPGDNSAWLEPANRFQFLVARRFAAVVVGVEG